jgi:hypothetical protein
MAFIDPRAIAQTDQGLDTVRIHLATSSSAIQAAIVGLATAPSLTGCDLVIAQISALEAVVRRLRVQLTGSGVCCEREANVR